MLYAELHCHSAFSFLDGASSPDELVDAAVAHGYSALALTDHDNLCGAMEFAQAAKAAGLKAIHGAEVRVAHEREHTTARKKPLRVAPAAIDRIAEELNSPMKSQELKKTWGPATDNSTSFVEMACGTPVLAVVFGTTKTSIHISRDLATDSFQLEENFYKEWTRKFGEKYLES